MIPFFAKTRLLFRNLLTQGLTPNRIAATVAIGFTIGTMPIVWGTTVICVLLASLFRLNHPGIQAANYLILPLQLILFLPFHRVGQMIFLRSSAPSHATRFNILSHPAEAFAAFASSTLGAVAVWATFAIPFGLTIYFGVLHLVNSRIRNFEK